MSFQSFLGACELTIGDTKIVVSDVQISVEQYMIDVTPHGGPQQSVPGLRHTSISASCAMASTLRDVLMNGRPLPIRLSRPQSVLVGTGRVVKVGHRTGVPPGLVYTIGIEGTDFHYEAVDDLRGAFARAQEQAAREKDAAAAVAVAATVARR